VRITACLRLSRKERETHGCALTGFFLSHLLGRIRKADLQGIDWVIVGGESGPRARLMSSSRVEEIRDQCLKVKTPFFFKQWGGFNKKKTGRILNGRTWDEMPVSAR
jgi:protein gp37